MKKRLLLMLEYCRNYDRGDRGGKPRRLKPDNHALSSITVVDGRLIEFVISL